MLPGEKINDVEYISEMGAYVVVGNFTSIQGQPRNKVAFLDEDFNLLPNDLIPAGTFQVSSYFPAINSVAYAKKRRVFLNGDLIYHYIVLGGDFQCFDQNDINNRNLMFFVFQGPSLTPSSTFNLVSHDYIIYYHEVLDLEFFSDTLHVAGDIDGYGIGSTIYDKDYGLFKLRPDLSGLLQPLHPPQTSALNVTTSILRHNNKYYIGNGTLESNNPKEFNSNWVQNTNFSTFNGASADPNVVELFSLNDSTIGHIYRGGGAGGEYLRLNSTTGFYPQQNVCTWNNNFPLTYGVDSYNQDMFSFEESFNNTGPRLMRRRLAGANFGLNSSLTFSTVKTIQIGKSSTIPMDLKENLIIAKNRLILSHDKISSVDGTPRQNVAIFCLEPKNPKPFSQADTTVCFGDTNVYTIPVADYSEGFIWRYSGQGAKYRIAGTSQVFQPLDSVSVNLLSGNANSIEIAFGPTTTAGTLSVQPFNTCNNSTDYLFARERTIDLVIPQLPHIEMADSMAFTCIVDTLDLYINSTTPNVTFDWEWNGFLQNINNDSIQLVSDNFIGATTYYGIVKEPIEGCQSIDSTHVYLNDSTPDISQSDIIQTPNPFGCSDNVVTVDLPYNGSATQWQIAADSANLLSSPLQLFSTDTIAVTAVVTDTLNGCSSLQQYEIQLATEVLDGLVNGIAVQTGVIMDILDCNNPTITLNAAPSSPNGTANWIVDGNNIGSTLNLSEADTVGMSNNVQVYILETYNNASGCTKIENVIVQFNFEKPFIVQESDNSLNCSQNSVELIHTPTFGASQQGWLINNTNTLNDTLVVSQVGQYVYEVIGTNGCASYDTIEINQSNGLFLDLLEDTLVCPGENISLNVSSVNNNDPTTFTWSNGTTGSTAQATGGQDAFLAVEATTTTGCVGRDTVLINITPPVEVEFTNTSTCSSGAISITNILGGAGNFSFAIDNGPWQNETFFDSLNFGNYLISVQDDLGCLYNFNHTLGSTAESPDINFLASTYNGEGDTLAIVNISTFAGFDSLNWILPIESNVFSESDSMVIVSLPNKGWYDIELKGYIDTCSYGMTKSIYFGGTGIVYDSSGDNAGIQNINLYPNPTNGQFTLTFEMSVAQNYSVVVTNMNGQPIPSMTQNGSGDDIELNFIFPIGTPNGSYKIHIIADFDANHRTIILNN